MTTLLADILTTRIDGLRNLAYTALDRITAADTRIDVTDANLRDTNETLRLAVADLREANAALAKRVVDLERRLDTK